MDLSKGTAQGDDAVFWLTEDYCIIPAEEAEGYCLLNRNTGQVEITVMQEPSAIMALLWLQETYDEVMRDPMAHYQERKDALAAAFARHLGDDEDEFTLN